MDFLDNIRDKLPDNPFGRWLGNHLAPLVVAVILMAGLAVSGQRILEEIAPNVMLAYAMEQTGEEMERRFENAPYQGIATVLKALKQGTISLDASRDGFSMGSAITYNQNDRVYGVDTWMRDGENHWAGQAYVNQQELAFKREGMEQGYGVTFATFEEDLARSVAADYMSQEEQAELVESMAQLAEILAKPPMPPQGDYVEITENFYKTLEFDTNHRATLLGGKAVDCTVYSTLLTGEILHDYLEKMVDELEDDQVIMSWLGAGEEIAQKEDVIQQLRWDIANLTDDLELEVSYYVNQNKMVKLVLDGYIKVEGERFQLKSTLDLGQNPATDDWSWVLTLDGLTMALTHHVENLEDTYGETWVLSMEGLEDTTFQMDWNRQSGALDLRLDGALTDGEVYENTAMLWIEPEEMTLEIEDFVEMDLILTVTDQDQVEEFDFVNIDQWEKDVMTQDFLAQINR